MEFKQDRLDSFCAVKGGKRLPKGVNLLTTKNAHPYIRIRDLGKSRLVDISDDFAYVDNETQSKIAKYITHKGDILISIVGTIGLIGIVGETLNEANLTENCVKLINFHNIERDYLYYFLISNAGQHQISRGTVGAVQPKLPIKNIEAIEISYPSIENQKKIAAFLNSISRKIETNIQINKNLAA